MNGKRVVLLLTAVCCLGAASAVATEFHKPYSPPCVERENVFEFTQKPTCRYLGNDKYEIAFAVKGYCDVTVGVVDGAGKVVRHMACGVLGRNAPAPFQKNSLKQKIYWDGKNDLGDYLREPGKLRVRVMLGLKPEFDKRLGGTGPHNLPARILGMTADSSGVYIFTFGRRNKLYLRKFGLDGKYLASLLPPPANLPADKLQGNGYIEYEPGKRALHAPDVNQTTCDHLVYPCRLGKYLAVIQPAMAGGRLYFLGDNADRNRPSKIYRIFPDGSTDAKGITGMDFIPSKHTSPLLAVAPDGRRLYMTGVGRSAGRGNAAPVVLAWDVQGGRPAKVFLGDFKRPGSDNKHFNNPRGIACDAAGRVYVSDNFNNRIQVFSAGGAFLKTIPIKRPTFLAVHRKTGAIYVEHGARVHGKAVLRTSKLKSYEDPKIEAYVDGPYGPMALDSWSVVPRLWFANGGSSWTRGDTAARGRHDVEIWEENGRSFKKVMDFDEEARKEDGKRFVGRWSGSALGKKLVCDPKREQLFTGGLIYDLKSGNVLRQVHVHRSIDDFAFDKRGYLHCHFNPGFYMQGVARLDPDNASPVQLRRGEPARPWPQVSYAECPYDYGVGAAGKKNRSRWKGILPVKDQGGSKFFQDGIGVNMRGDIAEVCYVYYVPKMDDIGRMALEGSTNGSINPNRQISAGCASGAPTYTAFLKQIADLEKKGIKTEFIKRRPGVPLAGGTIWTWNWNGELRKEYAVLAGGLINGAQMDEDYSVYTVASRVKMVGERQFFLERKAAHFGAPEKKSNVWTGTLIKTKPDTHCEIHEAGSLIPMNPLPTRPPDLAFPGGGYINSGSLSSKSGSLSKKSYNWVEGADWLYGGVSPIVPFQPCSCPTERMHLDWFKRAYVPEQYRHSIGILDTAGNLIMHLGRYGNFDSGNGAKSPIPVGGDNITMCAVRFISGTDNYLCFEDNGERLVVLKLNYHREETVPIKMK